MCGICGLIVEDTRENRESRVAAMVAALGHRGPDASGVWSAEQAGVTLGHARLAILDVSPLGQQPMRSSSGRYTIVYNGEIYNFKELRSDLQKEGASFQGGSDTEVLLAAIEAYGVEQALMKVNGMFAFGLWDASERTITLARDRLGIKPLFYGLVGEDFLFASELKAFKAAGASLVLNRNAVGEFLRYSYVPTPLSIAEGVFKLEPGCFVCLSEQQLRSKEELNQRAQKYWRMKEVAAVDCDLSGMEAQEAVRQAIQDAVARRLVSDVPLGAFLSGGIDSSLVVACMQAVSSEPVRTFTIGFEETGYNEAEDAKAVAEHLGTQHTELYLTASEAQAVIPSLSRVYDEPFADSSQIPTLLLSQLASEYVTVCLSGDGGDELFCGYNRYIWAEKVWQLLKRVPVPLRRVLQSVLVRVAPRYWDVLFRAFAKILPDSTQFKLPGDKLAKLFSLMDVQTFPELYERLISHWDTPPLLNMQNFISTSCVELHSPYESSVSMQMMYTDSIAYLPDDLLVKVDRASMAHSLEVRVPLLDHTLVELVWRIDEQTRTAQRSGRGKVLLRDILTDFVPKEVFERPKMGFSVPVGEWLRGPLRDWAEHLLDEKRLELQGLLAVSTVREKWADHLSLRSNSQYHLWDILMLQSWLDEGFVDV